MTSTQRMKAAIQVLLGRKVASPLPKKPVLPDFSAKPIFSAIEEFAKNHSLEFCFSEFGEERTNGGGNMELSEDRLEPTLSSVKKYFPSAKLTVYTDFDLKADGVTIKKVDNSVLPGKEHPRYLYRTADYYKFKSLLESKADFACILDSDMVLCSNSVHALPFLTQKFGFCSASNPRNLIKKDLKLSKDVVEINDESQNMGHSYNQSPMTLWTANPNGRKFFEKCCEIMEREPSRASLVMWKSAWETGLSPYLLPSEWCVCGEDVGIEDEAILHIGHNEVKKYYKL